VPVGSRIRVIYDFNYTCEYFDNVTLAKRLESGLLRMETGRNFANVGRKTKVSGQNWKHFMSNSPWSGPDLIEAIQNEIKIPPSISRSHFSIGRKC
jgi:hypothetical protein